MRLFCYNLHLVLLKKGAWNRGLDLRTELLLRLYLESLLAVIDEVNVVFDSFALGVGTDDIHESSPSCALELVVFVTLFVSYMHVKPKVRLFVLDVAAFQTRT